MTTTAVPVYRVLGTTDDVTDCEVCGRADLKMTVVLSVGGDGELYAGSDCAARRTGKPVRDIDREARAGDHARCEEQRRTAFELACREQRVFMDWVSATFAVPRFDDYNHLGRVMDALRVYRRSGQWPDWVSLPARWGPAFLPLPVESTFELRNLYARADRDAGED